MNDLLQQRFRGCLIGLAVGDALGGRFEAQPAEFIRGRISNAEQLVSYVTSELWYTDDTQMAIGVAESLSDYQEIVEERLCESFVANYVPTRGYGRGARAVLEAMECGRDYQAVAARHFPGGSYGNGAAMRVAPVGLFFRDNYQQVFAQARLSAIPTHLHPLGIEGAQLLALAIAFVTNMEQFNRASFFHHLLEHCQTDKFRAKLKTAAKIQNSEELMSLGNGIEALNSVPTAIACFALNSDSFMDTIADAIFLGGDTDTIASMAGSISGAHLGLDCIPDILRKHLEDSPKGGTYILELSDRLHCSYVNRTTNLANGA